MAANDILTSAEVKAYLGISGTAQDTNIAAWITEISSEIEAWTKNKIASQTVTAEISDGNGTTIHYPKYSPVSAVSTIEYRNDPNSAWTTLETDTDLILIDPVDGYYIELYSKVFPAGTANVKITYTAGNATIPGDIKRVAYEMVALRFRESSTAGLGQSRVGLASTGISNAGVNQTTSFKNIWPEWEKVLRRYKRQHPATYLVR